MVDNGYFSAARDREIIEAGGFWCSACLTGRPANEQSDDPRYCQGCHELLSKEAALLSSKRGQPAWVPVSGHIEACPAVEEVATKPSHHTLPPRGVLQHTGGRPKKEGEVHRTTKWRRKKEAQGALI